MIGMRRVRAPDAQTVITQGMAAAEIAQVVASVGVAPAAGVPWGLGREIVFDWGLHNVSAMSIYSGSSVRSPAVGAAMLKFTAHASVVAESAVITVNDDTESSRNIKGIGVFSNIAIDGRENDAVHAFDVHGVWGVNGGNDGAAPVFYDCLIANCTGSGVKLDNRDQLISHRLKCIGNLQYGLHMKDVSDSKQFGLGCGGNAMGAVMIDHCATPSIIGFDMWLDAATFVGDFTLTLKDQLNARLTNGEISGRVGILGRNDTGNEWEMAGNVFTNVNFKLDNELDRSWTYTRDDAATVTVSAYIYARDSEDIILIRPKIGIDPTNATDISQSPDYFIQFDSQQNAAHRGFCRITSGSGLTARRSRLGDADLPVLGFKKNISNAPWLVEWDFPVGAPVLMKYDSGNPPLNYVLCSPYGGAAVNYNKADYPWGFLWVTGLDLDNVATTWQAPFEPTSPESGYRYMVRVWP